MKFAHSFTEELQSNQYPAEWLEAAIRYRELKKCIKKVQRELAALGLTAEMLKMLTEEKTACNIAQTIPSGRITTIMDDHTRERDVHLLRRGSHDSQTSEGSEASSGAESEEFDEKEELKKEQALEQALEQAVSEEVEDEKEAKPRGQGITFSYWFDGTLESFVPKLVFTVDSEDGGLPINVKLAPETRQALEKLVASQQQGLPTIASTEAVEAEPAVEAVYDSDIGIANGHEHQEGNDDVDLPPLQEISVRRKRRDSQHQVLVPLSSDLEFFRTLTHEISSIDEIQSREESAIKTHIESLSDLITTVSKPSSLSRSSDLYPWREIFQLYAESGIFFSTRELDGHKQRTAENAEEKIKVFRAEMERRGILKSFRNKKSGGLLDQFVGVNLEILKLLRFQEINKTAMRKILKKFDKRTALTASQSFATFIASNPFISSQLARVLCYALSERLLSIIPQLDDYLCPICSSISVKPVRLSCSHVFCVRCLVKLQREHKRSCPICRGDVVMQADSGNLDLGLLNFLKHYFPKESKIKQQENEREVTLEQFRALQSQGVGIKGAGCAIM